MRITATVGHYFPYTRTQDARRDTEIEVEIERMERLCIINGIVKWYNCPGKHCPAPKTITINAILASNSTPDYTCKKLKVRPRRYFFTHIYSRIGPNSQEVEGT